MEQEILVDSYLYINHLHQITKQIAILFVLSQVFCPRDFSPPAVEEKYEFLWVFWPLASVWGERVRTREKGEGKTERNY